VENQQNTDKLALIADVVSSYLRRNSVSTDQIGTVVASVTRAIGDAEKQLAGGGVEVGASPDIATTARPEPAVSVRSSVKPDFIICLDCGAKVKTLKRHLQSAHGLDPKQYRERWELKKDYPMTAPAYSERRSAMARDLGLGRKAGEAGKAAKKSPWRGKRKEPAASPASE
jgi:predicted transcriptional regulator